MRSPRFRGIKHVSERKVTPPTHAFDSDAACRRSRPCRRSAWRRPCRTRRRSSSRCRACGGWTQWCRPTSPGWPCVRTERTACWPGSCRRRARGSRGTGRCSAACRRTGSRCGVRCGACRGAGNCACSCARTCAGRSAPRSWPACRGARSCRGGPKRRGVRPAGGPSRSVACKDAPCWRGRRYRSQGLHAGG